MPSHQSASMHNSPHQRPFIRDEQWDKKWRDAWDQAKPSKRKKWLIDAGFERSATNFMYRTWRFITPDMRRDVITILKREIKNQPQKQEVDADPQKQFWWNKENE